MNCTFRILYYQSATMDIEVDSLDVEPSIDIHQLGGVFTMHNTYDELSENLKCIYNQFIKDPLSELKLDQPPEYYGPVIGDYTKQNKLKYKKRLKGWITDVLTLRFFHKRNPKVDVFERAINLGDFTIAKTHKLSKIAILKTKVDFTAKIACLLEMKATNRFIAECCYRSWYWEAICYLMQQNMIPRKRYNYLLMRAVISGNLPAVKTLVENKANPNAYSGDYVRGWRRTPLIKAAECKHMHIIQYLLGFKPDRDSMRQSITIAISLDYLDYIKIAIQNNLYPKFDYQGYFNLAVRSGSYKILEYLIKSGFTQNIETKNGCIDTIKFGDLNLTKLLLPLVSKSDIYKDHYVSTACIEGHSSLLRYFMSLGYRIKKDKIFYTLDLVISMDCLDVFIYLLEEYPEIKSDPEFVDLVRAAMNYESVKVLTYLYKNCGYQQQIHIMDLHRLILRKGTVDMLKEIDHPLEDSIKEMWLDTTMKRGRLDMIEYIINACPDHYNIPGLLTRSIVTCQNHIVKFLITKVEQPTMKMAKSFATKAISCDNLGALKIILTVIPKVQTRITKMVSEEGLLSAAKFMFKHNLFSYPAYMILVSRGSDNPCVALYLESMGIDTLYSNQDEMCYMEDMDEYR